MDVTEFPMVAETRAVHPENTEDPTDSTKSGMTMDLREVQSENA